MRTYSNTNPIYDARFATYEDDVNRVIGNINFNYSPTDWLAFSYRLGNDFYSDQRTEITPGPKGIDGEWASPGAENMTELQHVVKILLFLNFTTSVQPLRFLPVNTNP